MLSIVRGAHRARVPGSPADPVKPMVPRRPYVVAAGLVALLNGWTFAVLLGVGVPGLLIGALYALPVAVSWYRPLAAWWIMLGVLLAVTALDIDDWGPWLLSELLAQAPVLFTVALVSARRVTAVVFVTTLGAGVLSELWVRSQAPHVDQALVNWGLGLAVVTIIGHGLRMRRLSTLRVAEEFGKRRLLEERAALGPSNGRSQLRLPYRLGVLPNHGWAHLQTGLKRPGTPGGKTLQVPVYTIDHVCEARRVPWVNFLKIDVEGFESAVLRGGLRTIERHRPGLLLEIEDRHLEKYGMTADDVTEPLLTMGYRMYAWLRNRWQHIDEPTPRRRNYLFSARL